MEENIEKLISKYFSGELSVQEAQELTDWVQKDDNRRLFDEYVEINFSIENLKTTKDEHSKLLECIQQEIQKPVKLYRCTKYGIAATIAILVSLLFVFRESIFKPKVLITIDNKIKTGSDKAILILENGTKVFLDKDKTYEDKDILSNGKGIVYKKSKEKLIKVSYNYLTIPRGGEFFIKLSDDTKVWLNSETQLKYPVNFKEGETRKVELIYGEAYFEVSHSTEHKGSRFLVYNKSQEIEVLGTEFNVKAYKDEEIVYTTLVNGKIVLSTADKKQMLKPNEQAKFNLKTNTLSLAKVDVYREISWKEGVFSFRRKPLVDIMKVLSRWYDMEVVFTKPDLKNAGFNGVLDKNQNIEDILKTIQSFGIIKDYEIKANKVFIK